MEYFDKNGKMREHVYNLNGVIYYKGVPIQKAKSSLVTEKKESIDDKGKIQRKERKVGSVAVRIFVALLLVCLGVAKSYAEDHADELENTFKEAFHAFFDDSDASLPTDDVNDTDDSDAVDYSDDTDAADYSGPAEYDAALKEEANLPAANSVSELGVLNVGGVEFRIGETYGELKKRMNKEEYDCDEMVSEPYSSIYVYDRNNDNTFLCYCSSDYLEEGQDVEESRIAYLTPMYYYGGDNNFVEHNWCVAYGIHNGMSSVELIACAEGQGAEILYDEDDNVEGFSKDDYYYFFEIFDDVVVNVNIYN